MLDGFSFAVTETILSNDDIPWEVLKRRGHESVRLMELTRFYLELQKDPHGPEVAMFVGNLPANLSQKQYETLLMEFLDEGTYCMAFLFQENIHTFSSFKGANSHLLDLFTTSMGPW